MLNTRDDFPMLKQKMHGHPLIYFDNGATALKPQVMIDAVTDFYTHHYGTVHRSIYSLSSFATEKYQQARKRAQKLLNAKRSEEIIFTRGTTESINLIATCVGKRYLKKGDEVIISEIEHHANIVPWQMVCEEHGAILRFIPADDRGVLDTEAYKNMLSEKTRFVSIAHISNVLGTVHPVKEIIDAAHAAGALVLIDGAQAAPHQPVDVQDLDADFYVFSGHKMYGPTGIGVLYGKEKWLEELPPYQGGGDMIETVTLAKTTFNHPPMKFEAGTPPIAQAIGLDAAIDYIQHLGLENIYAYEQELLESLTEGLEQIEGLKILGTAPEKGAIVSFVVDGVHPLDIGTFVDLKGIAVRTGHHCAQPTMARYGVSATVRASLSFYNTHVEIERFLEILSATIKTLK
jgi:cysteine desulfurase / selenocysteine lyase